jgi:hypothetical protein
MPSKRWMRILVGAATGAAVAGVVLVVTWTSSVGRETVVSSTAAAACETAWTSGGTPLRVDAAYPGSARSFLPWISAAFSHEVTNVDAVRAERNDPMVVCYLSGTFSGIPTLWFVRAHDSRVSAPAYTHVVVAQDERTKAVQLLVAGASGSWSFSPPSST